MNYITGEKIQELTDHTVIFSNQLNMRVIEEQLNNTNCNCHVYGANTKDNGHIPKEIMEAKSLFVYTYSLGMFLKRIYPLLSNKFILVTHNSDWEINSSVERYLNEGKIKRWYSQNVDFEHPKLISVPIGIANSQWEHGNLQLLSRIKNENHQKTNLVYKNFDVRTSIARRLGVLEKTQNIPLIRNRTQTEYWTDIASSKFNICPMGNGIDTHRMWESIYLDSIPIVQDCINNRQYQELPILIVSDWSSITPEFLEKKYEEINSKEYNYSKATLKYWKEEINKE